MVKLRLNKAEQNTSGWQITEHFLQARLQELREQNDSNSLSAERTAAIRGQIELIKEMLGVAKESPTYKPVSANIG